MTKTIALLTLAGFVFSGCIVVRDKHHARPGVVKVHVDDRDSDHRGHGHGHHKGKGKGHHKHDHDHDSDSHKASARRD